MTMSAILARRAVGDSGTLSLHRLPDPATLVLARVTGVAPAVAATLLNHYGSLGDLRHVDAPTLHATHGLTRHQASRLVDALDLATRLLVEPKEERPRVTSPRDAARLVLPEMGLLESEQMRVLLLDTSLILAHNHPSGAVEPSPEDVALTRELVQAGHLLGVDVLDHLVVAAGAYTSLHERGLGWE